MLKKNALSVNIQLYYILYYIYILNSSSITILIADKIICYGKYIKYQNSI